MLRFISLIETNPDKFGFDPTVDRPRSSALAVGGSSVPVDSLRVVGVLPHGYEFKPATPDDRDALVEYLEGIVYS
jgi:hypothetical protein